MWFMRADGVSTPFPVNSYEAESRRLARFFRMGHTPKHVKVKSLMHNTDHPFMLDLRRK
jgi:uncharacterized protein (DUF2126 family)